MKSVVNLDPSTWPKWILLGDNSLLCQRCKTKTPIPLPMTIPMFNGACAGFCQDHADCKET